MKLGSAGGERGLGGRRGLGSSGGLAGRRGVWGWGPPCLWPRATPARVSGDSGALCPRQKGLGRRGPGCGGGAQLRSQGPQGCELLLCSSACACGVLRPLPCGVIMCPPSPDPTGGGPGRRKGGCLKVAARLGRVWAPREELWVRTEGRLGCRPVGDWVPVLAPQKVRVEWEALPGADLEAVCLRHHE